MARDDDEERGGGRNPKTARAIRILGHAAAGGHAHRGKQTDAWDEDDDEAETGGDMPFYEYPKHLHLWDDEPARFIQVENAGEEAEAREKFAVVRPGEDRKRLLAIAEVRGLKVDGRWALDKIEAAIVASGGDPNADPTK